MRSLTQVQDASRSLSITMSSYSEGILSMFTDYVHTGIRRFSVSVCVCNRSQQHSCTYYTAQTDL